MRFLMKFVHPRDGREYPVTSVRVIPGGEPMSDAGLERYAGLSREEIELGSSRVRSVRGPTGKDRLILGYIKRSSDTYVADSESYMIVPIKIIG